MTDDYESLLRHGRAAAHQGSFEDAVQAFRRAAQSRPEAYEAFYQLGMCLFAVRRFAEAAVALESAADCTLAPIDVRYQLALTYRAMDRYADAEREICDVIAQMPTHAKAHSLWGLILTESGRAEEAVGIFARAMELDPNAINAATNWLNTHQYLPGITEARLATVHKAWAERYMPPAPVHDFPNQRTTNRRLNVGFISPDFGDHPVGMLSVRLFENLDRARIRATVFSTRPALYESAISQRIARATNWVTVPGLPDRDLAEFIRASGIDILVDVSGHTAGHRLGVFSARAAPVQSTWLGYTGTTGLEAMDYIVANEVLIPSAMDPFYTERVIRLPGWHACFDPPRDAPDVSSSPAARNGFVTFGCFNNPAKLNIEVVTSFAAVLRRTPGSKLKLKYKSLIERTTQDRLLASFAAQGVASDRLDISGHASRTAFLGAYNDVDVVLDTFPYSGCITTCEALWMGCPVVTFPGSTFAGRQSAAVLLAADLPQLVAENRADFEVRAVELARDQDRLSSLRRELRTTLGASAVCDGGTFARQFTAALENVWADWCHRA